VGGLESYLLTKSAAVIDLTNQISLGGRFSCPSTFKSGTIIMVAVPWAKRFSLGAGYQPRGIVKFLQ